MYVLKNVHHQMRSIPCASLFRIFTQSTAGELFFPVIHIKLDFEIISVDLIINNQRIKDRLFSLFYIRFGVFIELTGASVSTKQLLCIVRCKKYGEYLPRQERQSSLKTQK